MSSDWRPHISISSPIYTALQQHLMETNFTAHRLLLSICASNRASQTLDSNGRQAPSSLRLTILMRRLREVIASIERRLSSCQPAMNQKESPFNLASLRQTSRCQPMASRAAQPQSKRAPSSLSASNTKRLKASFLSLIPRPVRIASSIFNLKKSAFDVAFLKLSIGG